MLLPVFQESRLTADCNGIHTCLSEHLTLTAENHKIISLFSFTLKCINAFYFNPIIDRSLAIL